MGEFKWKDPISTRRLNTSRRFQTRHKKARRTHVVLLRCGVNGFVNGFIGQFSTISIVEMWTTSEWFLNFSCAGVRSPSVFLFAVATNTCCFAWVVGGGEFYDTWDLGSQKSFHHSGPSLMRPNEFWTHPDEGAARAQAPGCQGSSCRSVRRGRGGDWYNQQRGARQAEGFSPGAAARHSQSARVHTDKNQP